MIRNNRRRVARDNNQLPEITLTPLIDTALTLLIIFMVAVPVMNNNIKVQLPQGQKKELDSRKDDIIVTIDSQGKLFINQTGVEKTALIQEIKKLMKNQDHVVFIRADASINWGAVSDLIQYLKSIGGIPFIAMATQKR